MPAKETREFCLGFRRGVSAAGRFCSVPPPVSARWARGCATSDDMIRAEAAKWYALKPNEKFPIPAVDVSKIDPKYFRQIVRYESKEAPARFSLIPQSLRLPHRRRRNRHPLWRECRPRRLPVER